MTAKSDPVDQMAYNLRLVDVAEEPKKLLLPIEGYEKMPLVTLEEAIQPIIDILPKIDERVYIAKYNAENSTGGLTLDLAAAIMLYTMGTSSDHQPLYYVLNSILRSDQADRSDQLKPWFLYLKLFITALSYIPSYCGTVYRGVKLDISARYTVGKKFVWWGFSSCTKSLSVLQSEVFLGQQGVGTLFVIECFSGKEIRHHSHYEKEDEVLLVAARQFIVVSRLNPTPHSWIIQVKEIQPPFPFLKTDSSISSKLEISLVDDTNNSSSSSPANICLKCSKTISNVLVLDAETNTNDLLYNIEFNKEILSDEKLDADNNFQVEAVGSELSKLNLNRSVSLKNINFAGNDDETEKSEILAGDSSISLPPVLINSVVCVGTTNNQAMNPPISDRSNVQITTERDTLVSIEPIKDVTLVTKMFLKNVLVTEESAKTIAENIRQNIALEILYFCNNGLNDTALHHIIQAIIDRSRRRVFINDNIITDQSAKFLVDILSSAPNAISQLNLERNRITTQGVKSIVQALTAISNSGLKALSFAGNLSINDTCIDDIIRLLNENQTLKSLYLDKCNLSDDGKKRLRLAMTEKKAIFLQL